MFKNKTRDEKIKSLESELQELKMEVELLKYPNGKLVDKFISSTSPNFIDWFSKYEFYYNHKNKNIYILTCKHSLRDYTILKEGSITKISIKTLKFLSLVETEEYYRYFIIDSSDKVYETDEDWNVIIK